MITIKPYGGLGNRIRSIDSLIAATEKKQVPIKIIWEKTPSLYCSFDELFTLPGRVHVINKKKTQSLLVSKCFTLAGLILKRIGLRIPVGYKTYIFEKELKELKDANYDFRKLSEEKSVFIETQHRFFSIGKDFETFRPVESILKRVNKITSNFSSNTIGVHIRRTDNQKSIDFSPLELFIKQMQEAIQSDKETRFFLATDSIEEENTLKDLFKGRIIVQSDKKLRRNDPLAIKDALVDMLCLSKTKKILGSYWSSFSDTAASIGKIEIMVITRNK